MHAAEQALATLGAPLNYSILKALVEEGPCGPEDLRRAAGSPPNSTMRLYLRGLDELQLVERERQKSFPGTVECVITPAGEKLLEVGEVVRSWLKNAPHGPIFLGTPPAKGAIKALLGAWSTYMIRILAAKPMKLTDLQGVIPNSNYPAMERRLQAMRHVGQAEACPKNGTRGTPYRLTNWLRESVAPLALAIGWENEYVPHCAAPVGRADIEALFLLMVPLLELPETASGLYRLAVELRAEPAHTFAGVSLTVEGGKITACTTRWESSPAVVVTGDLLAWLRWIVKGDRERMAIEGNRSAGKQLHQAIRAAVTPTEAPARVS